MILSNYCIKIHLASLQQLQLIEQFFLGNRINTMKIIKTDSAQFCMIVYVMETVIFDTVKFSVIIYQSHKFHHI